MTILRDLVYVVGDYQVFSRNKSRIWAYDPSRVLILLELLYKEIPTPHRHRSFNDRRPLETIFSNRIFSPYKDSETRKEMI